MELTSLDLYYAVQELQSLAGAKVEKIYQSDTNKRDVFFLLYVKDAPKVHLRFLPGLLCTMQKPSYPQSPPGFAMFLRKYLEGTRVQSVQQMGFDRILLIEFASKVETYKLIIEFMHPGNMLLVDKENRIINLLETREFKDRTLRGRQPYVPPPASYNIIAATDEELVDRIIVSTNKSIVTTLALNMNLGGVYAEEVCHRAGVQKHRNDLSAVEVKVIVEKLREILKQPIAAHTDGEKIYPFTLESKSVQPMEETSFLTALATTVHDEQKGEAEHKQHQTKQSKLQVMIDAQRAQIAKFENESVQEQRKGERIYEEYQLMKEILDAVHEARQKKQNIAEILKRFKEVKGYKNATGEIEIDLE